jgi:hypothetical protein
MKLDFSLLLDPIIAMTILCVGLVIYIIVLDEEGMFSKKFLHFGPGTDATNTATFMGVNIDNWKKTISVYSISFVGTILLTYYNNSVLLYIQSFIRNPAVMKLEHKKHHLTIFLVFEILILFILNTLSIFTIMTAQFQFILPSLFAYFLIRLPTNLSYLNKKIF